jgi:hypothetical protein
VSVCCLSIGYELTTCLVGPAVDSRFALVVYVSDLLAIDVWVRLLTNLYSRLLESTAAM